MRILLFSTLYPNVAQPQHAVFVENRLRHLLAQGGIEARVVAPIPWFPLAGAAFGRYGVFSQAPGRETRFGIEIEHPRYPIIPKVGMSLAPLLMYAWSRPAVARLLRAGFEFDLIDAHYAYPDGVAAAMLGRHFGKPVTITARGTDINLIPRHALPRRMVRWAAGEAAGLVAVCQALKSAMVELDIPADKVRVLRNGVDIEQFHPVDPATARGALGVRAPVLLSVGGLIPRKGHDLIIRALPRLPEATLLIAGAGPMDTALRRLAADTGVGARVRFLGAVPHEALREVYSAADVLVLASDREGWPNVLLEAMACGTPVAATDVWGNGEVVTEPAAGRLIPTRDPATIAASVAALLADPPARPATRAYAERFTWDDTSRGQIDLFRDILGDTAPCRGHGSDGAPAQ